jgi:MFS transporter, putative metabolite:H+ symporter
MIDETPRESVAAPAVKPPGWYRLAWFLGRPPQLTERQWMMLGLVSAVGFFESYDLYLMALNLKQIQQELGIGEASLGLMLSFVRSGAFLALLILPFADRFGRRRVLIWTIIGYTLMTALTALSPNAETFVALQFLARAFAVAEALLATVVIVEEFAPENRGWGIGAAAAIQACGSGFAALMFGFVEVVPFGWRALYAVGVIPLCFIAYWRRTLPETGKFTQLANSSAALMQPLPMFSNLWRAAKEHPRSFAILAGTFFCLSMAGNSAGTFGPKYLQEVHAWAPSQIATLNLIGGALAIIGNPLGGWLSDRFGRRPTGSIFAFGYGVAVLAFYSFSGLLLPVLWIAYVFFSMGMDVTLSAYRTELFPTSMRSSAGGATHFVSVSGGIVGLMLVSVLYGVVGSTWTAILIVTSLTLLVPFAIWFLFPETARRSLDEISPEKVVEPTPEK